MEILEGLNYNRKESDLRQGKWVQKKKKENALRWSHTISFQ